MKNNDSIQRKKFQVIKTENASGVQSDSQKWSKQTMESKEI